MIKGDKYDGLKVDTWSCGVILFAMLCGYLPFEDPDTPSLYKKILSGTYTFQKGVSEQARDLIQKILTGDHTARPTIECIRGHQWMKQYDIKQCENGANRGIVVGVNKIPID